MTLLLVTLPLYGFYLPWISMKMQRGEFFAGYHWGVGGYYGTIVTFKSALPKTDLKLGFYRIGQDRGPTWINYGLIGISSQFSVGKRSISINFLVGRPLSSNSFLSGGSLLF